MKAVNHIRHVVRSLAVNHIRHVEKIKIPSTQKIVRSEKIKEEHELLKRKNENKIWIQKTIVALTHITPIEKSKK